ncbi:site-specific integrase [Streptomyces sp. A3M-1-3]|uniref:site-specific integrase n=1 Tax=Streptomyces sp. A3M-1-3 TaxID=2962044 RepID=UPI0020B8DA1F|nr:site-specific integrase [Streptomyces sp. A3M-1-3]MCP3822662.1 site-specific integrase [Streptomyces sp. A3M-1-3]
MHLIFYSSEGWQSWGLGAKPLIPEGMPVLIDADLLLEDAGRPRATVVINRWLRELPGLGVPARKSWEYYARVLRDWTRFLSEHGCNVFADRQQLKSVLGAYAVHRASGPVDVRLAASTWNQHVSVLSMFYRWSVDEGHASAEPFRYRQAQVLFDNVVRHLLLAEYRNYQQGVMPSGPGARQLIDFFTSVDGQLVAERPSPAVWGSDQEVRALISQRASTLHLGAANYCWFTDPSKALCLQLAGTPKADRPLAGLCDSARCPQATHHPCHRPVWIETVRTNKAFIDGLPRVQKAERTRLTAAVERGERVVAEIDAAAGEREDQGEDA